MGLKLQAFKLVLMQKINNFLSLLKQDMKTIWANNKVFFVLFGGIIAIIKFRQIIISLLVSNGKYVYNSAQKQSTQDQALENKDNAEANQLTTDANSLPQQESPVDVDWYKKDDKDEK